MLTLLRENEPNEQTFYVTFKHCWLHVDLKNVKWSIKRRKEMSLIEAWQHFITYKNSFSQFEGFRVCETQLFIIKISLIMVEILAHWNLSPIVKTHDTVFSSDCIWQCWLRFLFVFELYFSPLTHFPIFNLDRMLLSSLSPNIRFRRIFSFIYFP